MSDHDDPGGKARDDLGNLYDWLLNGARSGDKARIFVDAPPSMPLLRHTAAFMALMAELESSTIQTIVPISENAVRLVTAHAEVEADLLGDAPSDQFEGQKIVSVVLQGQAWHLRTANGHQLELGALRSVVVRAVHSR